MKTKNEKLLFVTLILSVLLLPVNSFSAPVITAINGSAAIQISGTYFGVKNSASPLINEKFNYGSGDPAGWNKTDNGTGTLSSNKSRTGTESLYFDYSVNVNNGFTGGRYTQYVGSQQSIYVTGWMWIDYEAKTNSTGSAQFKGWRMSNCADGYTQDSSCGAWYQDSWYNTSSYNWFNSGFLAIYGGSGLGGAPSDLYLKGQWQRIETYLSTDGTVWMNRVGRPTYIVNKTGLTVPSVGQYFSLGVAGQRQQEKLDVYFDSIYVDNTMARVELCDTSSWSNRTHCEIQAPTSWSDSSIDVTFNKGSFPDGKNVYFYVVDKKGIVNSTGYEYRIPSATLLPPVNVKQNN